MLGNDACGDGGGSTNDGRMLAVDFRFENDGAASGGGGGGGGMSSVSNEGMMLGLTGVMDERRETRVVLRVEVRRVFLGDFLVGECMMCACLRGDLWRVVDSESWAR